MTVFVLLKQAIFCSLGAASASNPSSNLGVNSAISSLIDIQNGKCDNRKDDTGKEAKAIAYKIITEKCATVPWLCGDCRPGCPNKAIGTAHTIDPNRCTECVGAYETPHCAEICPAGACVPDPAHRETKRQLLQKWRRLHPGEKPAPGTY